MVYSSSWVVRGRHHQGLWCSMFVASWGNLNSADFDGARGPGMCHPASRKDIPPQQQEVPARV